MKTTNETKRDFPKPFRFALYLLTVSAFCFLNWMAIYAGDPVTEYSRNLEIRLAAALIVDIDPEPVLEDWMLSFSDDYTAANAESEITLEDWMLTFSDDYIADNSEPEIALESWMVDYNEFCHAGETEPEQIFEEWMVNTSDWIKIEFLATK